MKKFFVLVVLLCAIMISSTASAARGKVAFYNERSGKIIIETGWQNYTCGKVMNITIYLNRGDEVEGDLEGFGSHEIYNVTDNETFSLWIDDYGLSRECALDWLEKNY